MGSDSESEEESSDEEAEEKKGAKKEEHKKESSNEDSSEQDGSEEDDTKKDGSEIESSEKDGSEKVGSGGDEDVGEKSEVDDADKKDGWWLRPPPSKTPVTFAAHQLSAQETEALLEVFSALSKGGSRLTVALISDFLEQCYGNSSARPREIAEVLAQASATGVPSLTKAEFVNFVGGSFREIEPQQELHDAWLLVGGSESGTGVVRAADLQVLFTAFGFGFPSDKKLLDFCRGAELLDYDMFVKILAEETGGNVFRTTLQSPVDVVDAKEAPAPPEPDALPHTDAGEHTDSATAQAEKPTGPKREDAEDSDESEEPQDQNREFANAAAKAKAKAKAMAAESSDTATEESEEED